MALKSILEIDVDDAAFKKFSNQFRAYQDALEKTKGSWAEAAKTIEKSDKSTASLAAGAAAYEQRVRVVAGNQKTAAEAMHRATSETTRQSRSWTQMAKDT